LFGEENTHEHGNHCLLCIGKPATDITLALKTDTATPMNTSIHIIFLFWQWK
jgi:hypothetical protein